MKLTGKCIDGRLMVIWSLASWEASENNIRSQTPHGLEMRAPGAELLPGREQAGDCPFLQTRHKHIG